MKKLLIIPALAFCLASCSDAPVEEKPAAQIIETSITGDANKTVANLHIEGVHCDGCRGKIKKELDSFDCVASATFSELEGAAESRAVVEFDPATCNYDELIQHVNQIVDGKYTVVRAEIVHMSVQ